MQNDTQNIIGVDVGSGSVRAGIFNLRGELLAHATREGGVSGNPRKFRHSALWNFLGGWSAA